VEILFILKSLAGLSVILIILVAVFLYPKKRAIKAKPTAKYPKEKKRRTELCTLDDILESMRDKTTSSKKLHEMIECLVKYHSKIPNKLGMRAHPDFDIYEEIILRLCHHPQTSKELILQLDRVLLKENPTYRVELNDALEKGLNTRSASLYGAPL